MKKIYVFLVTLILVLGLSVQAHATLILRGTDSLGIRLIYDNDLDITWYDYTTRDSWGNSMSWADALSINFGGAIYDDWRLPSSVDGPPVRSPDSGAPLNYESYNITGSEMGNLYYTELGNLGYCDTAGNCPQPSFGLTNTGPFTNLEASYYWSGTEYAPNVFSWVFNFYDGGQFLADNPTPDPAYALAVRDGDVASVPEPSTLLLLGSGLAGLAALRKRLGRKEG